MSCIKPTTDGTVGLAALRELAHVSDVVRGEARRRIVFSAYVTEHSTAMSIVIRLGQVLQVARVVPLLVAVLVVDLVSFWARADEGSGHELMRGGSSALSVADEHHSCVARGGIELENPSGHGVSISSAHALHTSVIADLVPTLVPDDRSPSLSHGGKG